MMEPVAGRMTERITFTSGLSIYPYQLTTEIEKISRLKRYQFELKDETLLLVRVVTEPVEQELLRDQVASALRPVLGPNVKTTVEICARLDENARNKFRLFIDKRPKAGRKNES